MQLLPQKQRLLLVREPGAATTMTRSLCRWAPVGGAAWLNYLSTPTVGRAAPVAAILRINGVLLSKLSLCLPPCAFPQDEGGGELEQSEGADGGGAADDALAAAVALAEADAGIVPGNARASADVRGCRGVPALDALPFGRQREGWSYWLSSAAVPRLQHRADSGW